jgi:hypothetical protein
MNNRFRRMVLKLITVKGGIIKLERKIILKESRWSIVSEG